MIRCFAFAVALTLAADHPSFIPARCCVSNGCCFVADPAEVRLQPNGMWKIEPSGEILPATGVSDDGRYWRCACDFDAAVGRYVAHRRARTYCLFIPPHSF